jgi:hypothetical protein
MCRIHSYLTSICVINDRHSAAHASDLYSSRFVERVRLIEHGYFRHQHFLTYCVFLFIYVASWAEVIEGHVERRVALAVAQASKESQLAVRTTLGKFLDNDLMNKIKDERNDLYGKVDDLIDRISKDNNSLVDRQAEMISDLRVTVDGLVTRLERFREGRIDALNGRVTAVEGNVADHEGRIGDLEALTVDHGGLMDEHEGRIDGHDENIAYNADLIANLQDQLAQAHETIATLRRMVVVLAVVHHEDRN